MRTGIIGKKIGMSRVLTEKGEHIPVTLIHVEACQVVSVKSQEKNGYTAVQVGVGQPKVKNVSKAMRGHFAVNNVEPKKKLVEFRVSPEGMLNTGDQLSVHHFVEGQFVDVASISIGKGFAGWIKRWNFGGMRASHGVSITHRHGGSTGQRQDAGRVFKNKKMPGHMGSKRVTTQNLKIVSMDEDTGIILIKGCVPGSKGTYVEICDAIKRPAKMELPFPAALINGATPTDVIATPHLDDQADVIHVDETEKAE